MLLPRTLRPLRATAVRRMPLAIRQISPICARTLITTTESSTASQPPPEAPNAVSQESGTIPTEPKQAKEVTQKAPPQLPYFVGRNSLNNLAVYQRSDRGGTFKTTLLKRGEGNLQALSFDVAEALKVPHKDVKVNPVTRHIQVKGHYRDRVIAFLRTLGF